MRVLFVNSVNGVGSTGKIVQDLAQHLLSNGNEVCIAYGRGKKQDNDIPSYFIGNKKSLYAHIIYTRLFDMHGFSSNEATREFIKFVEDYNPDIIHLHNIHGYFLNIEILLDYLKNKGIPVVCTLHDMWLFSGHAAYISASENGELPDRNTNFQQRFEYPKSYIDNSKQNFKKKKNIFNNFSNIYFVTPSQWLEKMVKKSFLSEHYVKTIYNGINLNSFLDTNSSPKLLKKKRVLAVANYWEKRKGLDDILYLNENLSQDEFQIVVVGKTDKKLPSSIEYHQQTKNVSELAELYSGASLFVNSSYSDNFPTTIIEAQACGTPVVTYNTGGSAESLTIRTGTTVPTGDREGLLNAIKSFPIVDTTTEECRTNSMQYSSEAMGKEYNNLYNDILKQKI